jgi:hypothetical protein
MAPILFQYASTALKQACAGVVGPVNEGDVLGV